MCASFFRLSEVYIVKKFLWPIYKTDKIIYVTDILNDIFIYYINTHGRKILPWNKDSIFKFMAGAFTCLHQYYKHFCIYYCLILEYNVNISTNYVCSLKQGKFEVAIFEEQTNIKTKSNTYFIPYHLWIEWRTNRRYDQ